MDSHQYHFMSTFTSHRELNMISFLVYQLKAIIHKSLQIFILHKYTIFVELYFSVYPQDFPDKTLSFHPMSFSF